MNQDLPQGGLLGKGARLLRRVTDLRIPLYSANACFFLILSFFPALVLLLSLLRYTGLELESLMEFLGPLLPAALRYTARQLVVSTYANSSGAMVGISAATALWSAGRGIYGLLTGLNAIYAVEEGRGYLRTRILSMAYTFAFLLVLLLTLILHVFGSALLRLLEPESPFFRFLTEAVSMRFLVLLALQTLLFTVMFMVLPNRRNGFRESLPGALLASLGWLIFSDLYSIYVEHFSHYANIYGSVYAVALSMLWLYCCLSIVFYGGALNRWLQGRRA